MNWNIYITNFCLLYFFQLSSSVDIIEIQTFEINMDDEFTHHQENNLVNFFLLIKNITSPTNCNISFYSSQSIRHVYFDDRQTRYKYCYLGSLKDTIDEDSFTYGLNQSVDLMFPNAECCEMAASLCVAIKPVHVENFTDEYCIAYGHGVRESEAAGYKNCNPGNDEKIIIAVAVCGAILFICLSATLCICCTKSRRNNGEDTHTDIQEHVSIDLKRTNHSPSFADTDTSVPLPTNLPSMNSFLFGSCSSLPQPEERLPQEFLSAFMKKYVEFVTEWNMSTKEKIDPGTVSNSGSRTSPPRLEVKPKPRQERRISIKRRKVKGVSAVYVNQWDAALEIRRDRLTLVEKVGEGEFGEVHKAILKQENASMTVAVKKLKSTASTDDRNNFLRELATHALLENHPHVIKLIGCCIEKEPMYVIFEYMAKGNLLDYLKNSPESVPTALNYVVTFGHHVAKGMAFLTATEVIHRDLAARNILINQSGVCKVADFGFAKDVFGVTKYKKKLQTAPLRWMAPESLLEGIFSTQSDVWSFGVLLWEIVTLGREVPYTDVRSIEIKTKLKGGLRLRRPGHCPSDLYELMSICWKDKPEDRPTFDELCKEFEELKKMGHYTNEPRVSHDRRPSRLRGMLNRITRQLSSGDGVI